MATITRPKNWPSLPPPLKPEIRPDPRSALRPHAEPPPVHKDTRERRQPYYHMLDWARGVDRDRGWALTEGRDHTKGTDRSRGRDRTGTFRF